jgi:hypothetical protein
MKILYSIVFIAGVTLLIDNTPLYGQSQEKVYSALMINFAKGIQWPDNPERGDFIIGVLEYPPLVEELSSSTKTIKINSKKIQVREFAHADEMEKCHIIFVPAYKTRQFPAVLNKLGTSPTLIITNKTDFAKRGSGVNFILIDGKLKYEINTRSIERRGMKISTGVKSMGIVVE